MVRGGMKRWICAVLLSAVMPCFIVAGEPPVCEPEAVIREAESCAAETGAWLIRERWAWERFLLGSGVSIVIGALVLWWSRRRLVVRRRGVRHSWRHEVAFALMPPCTVMLVFCFSFFFFQPVMKTLPPHFVELDVRLFYAAVTLIFAWGVLRVLAVADRGLRRFAARSDNALDALAVGMVGTTLRIVIAAAVLLFVGQNIFDLNITALLAGAGVIGLAAALAAKDTISNFFGTLVIVADAPFRPGDRICAGSVDGVVVRVGIRSTRIRTGDESICTVPNSLLTNTVVRRVCGRGYLKHSLEIGLTYGTTPEKLAAAMKILHELMDDLHGADDADHAPHIFFSGFGDSSVDIRALIWFKTGSFAEAEKQLDELNLSIFRRFRAAGLDFAYPTRTLYLAEPAARESVPGVRRSHC